jgi:hypothetical protein
MTDAHASGASTSELLRESWRLLRGHALLFVLLIGVAILAQLLAVLLMALVIVPMRSGESLREIWFAMDEWRKLAVFVLFLATLAVMYRALAASVFAAAEIRSGRSVSVLQALGRVRRKQLRLFWLILLVSVLAAPVGPLALVIALAFAFFCAPAFPVAILENLGAIKALQRGAQLAKGGQGRLALLFFLYLALVVAGVFAFIAAVLRHFPRLLHRRRERTTRRYTTPESVIPPLGNETTSATLPQPTACLCGRPHENATAVAANRSNRNTKPAGMNRFAKPPPPPG